MHDALAVHLLEAGEQVLHHGLDLAGLEIIFVLSNNYFTLIFSYNCPPSSS